VVAEIVGVDLLAEFGWETQETGLCLVALSAAGGLVFGTWDVWLFGGLALTLCLGWPCWRRIHLASHCSVWISGPFDCLLGSVSFVGGGDLEPRMGPSFVRLLAGGVHVDSKPVITAKTPELEGHDQWSSVSI
jgi:hypothetical protein